MIKETDARFSRFTPDKDAIYLRMAIKAGEDAKKAGNHPFGAILVDIDGNVLMKQENIEVTERDCTGHAETALLRKASKKYDKDFLWNCTLYSSFEPCCMCSGAAYWANIGRIVFAASEAALLEKTGDNELNPTFRSDCRGILERGQKDLVIRGPVKELEDEALAAHDGYWE